MVSDGKSKEQSTLAIIGQGRFGALLASLLEDHFDLLVYDQDEKAAAKAKAKAKNIKVVDLEQALACSTIIYSVPISLFEEIFASHAKQIADKKTKTTVIDVLSVKTHPKAVLEKHLPENAQALLTHPMFGPDSQKGKDLSGKRIVVDSINMDKEDYKFWVDFFKARSLEVIEISAEEHDRLAAKSQGMAHFIGRILEHTGMEATQIDTEGAHRLCQLKDVVANDTWQLFEDLQNYNPYSRESLVKLLNAQKAIYARAMPNRIEQEKLLIGIQGGKGSFNEEAARYYMSRSPEQAFDLVYLHTSERVLKALEEGEIDRGVFAIHNSIGGMVHESAWAMAGHRFTIIEEFGIKIAHALMIAKDATFEDIDTIMTHPQVLGQCKDNLQNKYSRLKLISGEGELIDHAKVAELLGKGEIAKNIATMGSKILAEIHGLKIVENDLQDMKSNFTSFLFVERLNNS